MYQHSNRISSHASLILYLFESLYGFGNQTHDSSLLNVGEQYHIKRAHRIMLSAEEIPLLLNGFYLKAMTKRFQVQVGLSEIPFHVLENSAVHPTCYRISAAKTMLCYFFHTLSCSIVEYER